MALLQPPLKFARERISMTPAAQIQTTTELLHTFHTQALPADGVLHHFFWKHRFVGSKDRQIIQSWVFSFYLSLASTLWIAQRLDPQLSRLSDLRVLLGLFLIRHNFLTYEAIHLLCDGQKHHPSPLKEHERRVLIAVASLHNATLPPEVLHEISEHWCTLLQASLGYALPLIAASLNQQASNDLRINTLKIPIDQGRVYTFQSAFPLTVILFTLQGISKLKTRDPSSSVILFILKPAWMCQIIALAPAAKHSRWLYLHVC
ncbi:hypothetical protein FGO68_gene6852 [Halteria grandinella]|uniref:Uncharacterized protein n=1 Tax=Halteria grandinella TaxID=5974 RepID=A0A8J8SVE2_HALGN|nr:hypothetical protein FGO68_gene6852 [Halteria grandinella]